MEHHASQAAFTGRRPGSLIGGLQSPAASRIRSCNATYGPRGNALSRRRCGMSGSLLVSFKLCACLICPTEPRFLEFGHAASAREAAKSSNSMARLSWPVSWGGSFLLSNDHLNWGGYTLQGTDRPASTNWNAVGGSPTDVNGSNQVVVPLTTNAFFRLLRQ